jgi:glycyl-tRNA synthetase beta chain
MAQELLLEIGTEEIPAGFLPKAMADMANLIRAELENAQLAFGAIRTLATPRRLLLVVEGIEEHQPTLRSEVMGPAKSVAFDAAGKPTKAGEGFARGQGVAVDQLVIVETEKGAYVCAKKEQAGRPTAELLTEILPRLVPAISFKKSMRWKDLEVRFARPVHWIVALYGGAVVPFSFGNIDSGNQTRGHRFMAPGVFEVKDFSQYLRECERHFVIVDPEKRKAIIRAEVARLAKEAGGEVLADEELLEQVAYLVEYPSAVLGTFNPDFLQVPKEVLITSMRSHQRYFSLVDASGKLMPAFITINNTLTPDPSVVVRGNERVLRARLSDARFFFEEDKKVPLATRVEALKSVVYQAKLGTSFEKMERFRALAVALAEQLAPTLKEQVARAATLCKADLVSGMVGEFPEVQGVMGREYALLEGEDAEVAQAIYEHYLPTQAGGAIPSGDLGAFVSIADKLDTLCGCFGVGLIPTGTADPYALRRSAIGILNIILGRGYRLSLPGLVDRSLDLLTAKLSRPRPEVRADVLEFLRLRLVNLLAGQGYPQDVVDAVLSASYEDVADALARVKALAELKGREDFEPLAVAFKRVVNIIKGGVDTPVAPALFAAPCEATLHEATGQAAGRVARAVAIGDYASALRAIAGLRGAVDGFFEGVMVMADQDAVRINRLALLTGVARLFEGIADFSRIAA